MGEIIEINHLLRRATPQERRAERLTITVREAPPIEEAHAARAGRLLLAAGAAINQVRNVSSLVDIISPLKIQLLVICRRFRSTGASTPP